MFQKNLKKILLGLEPGPNHVYIIFSTKCFNHFSNTLRFDIKIILQNMNNNLKILK